jgi:hypothetical protein
MLRTGEIEKRATFGTSGCYRTTRFVGYSGAMLRGCASHTGSLETPPQILASREEPSVNFRRRRIGDAAPGADPGGGEGSGAMAIATMSPGLIRR